MVPGKQCTNSNAGDGFNSKSTKCYFFSQVSLFEIAIKQKIGKLPLFTATTLEVFQQGIKDNFTFLHLKNDHLEIYQKVPLYEQHRDPFDRLLIATALSENMQVMTADKNFLLYPELINIVW